MTKSKIIINIIQKAEQYEIQIYKNCINHQKKPIFDRVPETKEIWNDIKTLVKSRDDFGKFIRALYMLVFETTKDQDPNNRFENGMPKPLHRLPKEAFKQNKHFMDIVDILRHTLGEAHTPSKLKIPAWKTSYPDALKELLGSKNEPQSQEEFQELQIAISKRFENFLKRVLEILKNDLNSSKEVHPTNPTPTKKHDTNEIKNNIPKEIKDICEGKKEPEDNENNESPQMKYWKHLQDVLKNDYNLRLSGQQHYSTLAIGKSNFYISVTFHTEEKRLSCGLCVKGKNAKDAFDKFKEEKEIEEELKDKLDKLDILEWDRGEDARESIRIRIRHYKDLDITKYDQWNEIDKWFKKYIELFYKVFKERIQNLRL